MATGGHEAHHAFQDQYVILFINLGRRHQEAVIPLFLWVRRAYLHDTQCRFLYYGLCCLTCIGTNAII